MVGTAPLPPARAAALDALELCLPLRGGSGQDVQAALNRTLPALCPDPRDKRLATELTYGTLRLKGRLEYLAASLMHKPQRTPPFLFRVLTLAAYEILYLDHIPHHATLSWAVDATRARLGENRAGLANALLRHLLDLGDAPREEDYYQTPGCPLEEFLARWHACPRWLVALWLKDYGPLTTVALLKAQTRQPVVGIRMNAREPESHGMYDELSCISGVTGLGFPSLVFDPDTGPSLATVQRLEESGRLTRQSPAVGAILASLESDSWPEPIWDCCAGRGGKTALLLEQGHRQVWASDLSLRRLRGLTGELTRLRLPAIPVFRADATRPALRTPPRTLLVDAPCSGLGVLSRRPDAKWKRTPRDIADLAAMQRRILDACARELPSGGRLIYLTCTATRAENDDQAEWLESTRSGLIRTHQIPLRTGGPSPEMLWAVAWRKR